MNSEGRRPFGWLSSMRARLILGVFVLIGIAAAYIVGEALDDRDAAISAAVQEAQTAAAAIPRTEREVRDSAMLLLDLLAQLPEIREPGSPDCSITLTRMLKSQARYNNLIVVMPDGTIACSAIPLAKPINLADRPWFQDATKARHFREGGFLIGRATNKPQRAYALPVYDSQDELTAVIAALLDLDWLSRTLGNTPLPPNSTLNVIDDTGRLLARFPDPEHYIGRDIGDTPFYREILSHPSGSSFRMAGLDGTERFYFAIPPSADPSHLAADYAAVGIPTAAIFSSTNESLKVRLGWLIVLGSLLLVGGYLAGELFIVRPLNSLVSLSRKIGAGDRTARSDVRHATTEFETLAGSLDAMAASLNIRAAALEREVAGHQRTEDLLRVSEERFRAISEIAAHWHWQTGPDLRLSEASQSYDRLSGRRFADARGLTIWQAAGDTDPPGAQLWAELRNKMLARESFRGFRYSILADDGRTRYRRMNGEPVFGRDGQFRGYRCAADDETAEVEAEQRAKAAEQLLAHAVESIPDGFAIYDASDKLVMMNSQYRKFLLPRVAEGAIGQTFDELVRAHLSAGYYPEAVGREQEFLQERLAAHRQPDKAHLYTDNRGIWILARDQQMADGTIVAIRTDVTDLEMIDEALRESRASLLQTQQVAKMGSWEIKLDNPNDPNANPLRWSDETYRIFGYKPGEVEVTNDLFLSAVHPADRERVRQAATLAVSSGDDSDLEHRLIRPDGREIIVRERSKVLHSTSTGKPLKIVGIVQDVTEIRETSERLQRSQALLTEMERIAGVGGWDLDIVNNDSMWTEGLLTIFGLTHADLPLKEDAILKYVHPDDRTRIRDEFQNSQRLGRAYSYQFRIIRPDGKERVVIERGDFVRNELGQPIRMIGVTMDITERWLAEEQLRQNHKMEAIGQLTGGIAHDFNNLLTIIIGNLELIEERPDARVGDEHPLIQMALGSALRGSDLVKRLLAIARQQPLRTEVVEVNRLIEDFRPLLHRSLGETVTVETALASDLWPVLTDPSQMENVLLNLAINARDAMAGGGTLTITTENVRVEADRNPKLPDLLPGDYVMLSVSDTGCGMPPEVQARALEPFFTTKGIGAGSGLGLAMVHGFVKQCGGHLLIYSEPGLGTTVKLYLPRIQGSLQTREPLGEPAEIPRGTETILLVEDDFMVRETAAVMLRDLGYNVVEAVDGPSAEKALESGTPVDLLFTDLVMPGGMSGWELVQAVWKSKPQLRVLFATGYADIPALRHSRMDERIRVLSKPYNKRQLALRLRRALDRAA